MFNAFGRLLRQLVPGSGTGGSLFQASDGSGKRSRWEGSCGAEHTVIYLLLQGGHVSARGLATLSCVSRAFRSACENESLWHLAATTQWPSLSCADVDHAIQSSGGYRRFFRLLFTPRMGDIQLSVPMTQSQQLIEDVTFFIDISYKDQPVFSRRFEGRSDLPQVQQADSVVFRPADIEVRTVLVDGRPNLSRRALERCARDLHTSCIALRTRDGKFCLLLEGKMSSSGMIGGSVYGSIQSTFALPGIFHVMCLTVDIVVTVTSRIREVERREDEAAAPGAAAGPAAPPAAAEPRADGGAGPAAPPATDAAAQRLGDGAGQAQGPEAAPGGGQQAARRTAPQTTGSAESGVGPATGAAASARNQGHQGAAAAGPAGDTRGAGSTATAALVGAGGGGGGAAATAASAAAGAAGPSTTGTGAADAPGPGTQAAAAGAANAATPGAGAEAVGGAVVGAGAAPVAAGAGAAAVAGAGPAAAPGAARAGAPNVETLLDIVLGDLSFQIKVNADQGEGRRSKRDPKWQDLKWR